MMHWLLDIFIPSVRAAGKKGWIMLGLDNHGCHTHPAFKAACAEHHIFLVFTPAYTTDITAPVDHHVGAFMKTIMQKLWEAELVEMYAYWTEDGVDMPGRAASHRRILMTQRTVESWRRTQQETTLLLRAFTSTGFLCKMDRSDVHLLKVVGWDYLYDPFDSQWDLD